MENKEKLRRFLIDYVMSTQLKSKWRKVENALKSVCVRVELKSKREEKSL